jgi:hypothetical protein
MARKLSARKRALPQFLTQALDAAPPDHQLNMTMQLQGENHSQWCWCAVSVSVSHYFDQTSTWTMCAMANAVLGKATCCQDEASKECNQTAALDEALSRSGNLDHMQDGAIQRADLEREIDARRPVSCRIAWDGSHAHFVSVDGYTPESSDDEMLSVKDPWTGPGQTPYSTLVSGYQGTGTWTHTYFQKAAS